LGESNREENMEAKMMLCRVAVVRTDVSEENTASKNLSVLRLLVTATAVPSSPILVTLMMEAV
jgi:hypothetical protein